GDERAHRARRVPRHRPRGPRGVPRGRDPGRWGLLRPGARCGVAAPVCDSADSPAAAGWRGWTTSDEVRPATAAGDWVDLRRPLSPSVPRLASFPPPSLGRFKSMPADPFNATAPSMVVRIGTPRDPANHFLLR